MNYQQCLSYLEQIQGLGMKFGLENVRIVLRALGDPHSQFPSVLVAGSNGKGSVCAMLSRILTLHGYRAGLFTSPHLVCYEERIRIGETLISKDDFCQILTRLKKKIGELLDSKQLEAHPTHFELLTCLAISFFQQRKVDLAVFEVGMGGRYDATNVVTPQITAITTISAEHQRSLGETLREIASEKAGILKPGVPVVCGVEAPEAYQTIREKAEACHSPFVGVFDRKECFQANRKKRDYVFDYRINGIVYSYSPLLPGKHQGKNAAVAISLTEELTKSWKKLDKEKIIEGIETTRWDGRLEVIDRRPLIVMDGAHNVEGALALREYVEEFIDSPLVLVFAAMSDKKIEELRDILFPLAHTVILTQFPYYRAAAPQEIKQRSSKFQGKIKLEPDVARAVHRALKSAGKDGAVLITGSLFLVGEVKKIFPF